MKNILWLFFILLLIGCNEEDTGLRGGNTEIEIYLVKEGQLEIHSSEIDLASLELENTPWVKNSDIELYDWSAHAFFLNCEKKKGKYEGRHFVVTSGQDRLFAGVFFPMYMSSIPQIPAIIPEDGFFTPKNVVEFRHFGYYFPGEMEEQKDFKAALFSAGLLREGIEVDLLSARKEDANTVEYSFEITNLDIENIYVADPDKMGSSRFYYITNGISFNQGNSYFNAENFNSSPFDEFQTDWYYKLKPGESIIRELSLTGFDSLPVGKVTARFSFPGSNFYSDDWKKKDGRIWMGDFRVEKEMSLQ
jgi:hypothetical protein